MSEPTHRTLIVARISDGAKNAVADLFARSDATELPQQIGVRNRTLFEFHGLYFHLIEADSDVRTGVNAIRNDPTFVKLSADLEPYISPYDPRQWRSPADAMARSFYHWENPRPNAS
jgi:cyclase